MSEEIYDRVKKLVAEHLAIDPEKVTPASTFDELGCDSLDLIELVMAVEEKFDIEIPDAEAEQLITVQDAVFYIENKGQLE